MWQFLGIEREYWIYIDVAFIFIIVSILVLIILLSKKKRVKPKVVPIDNEFLNQLFEAVGKTENIIKLSNEHQRLKIVLAQVNRVDTQKLRQLNIPAFLKGKELTLLIKNHTKEVISFFNDKIGEEN